MASGLCLRSALLALPIAVATLTAAAAEELYRARAFVTGQGEESREIAYAKALEAVLVKVSGNQRLFGDPRVAALADEAEDYVRGAEFRDRMAGIPIHDEQGSRDRPFDVFVDFVPERVDAALGSLGAKPWPEAERPKLLFLVAVEIGTAKYLLAGDGAKGRDQRDALADMVERYGLPLVLPRENDTAIAGITAGNLVSYRQEELDARAKALGADRALAGSLVWSDQALGWIANWRLASGGALQRWGIVGVSFDAAFRNALGGAAQLLSGNGAPK